jgi:hypothetical protein
MRIEKLKAQTTTQLAEIGKKTDAINQLKKELAESKVTDLALEARTKTLRDQLRASEEELQTKSNAPLEADRQLADNQAELAKMWAELGKRCWSPANLGFRRLLRVSCPSRLVHWAFQRRGYQIHLLGR